MRLLLVNQFFHPDHAATAQVATDLAEDLVQAGDEVTVVAARGSYLGGAPLPSRDEYRGIQIRRLTATSFGKRALVHRALDYASFYAAVVVELARLPAFDAAILMTTPPLVAAAGLVAKAMRGTPLVYWVQDLYPEVAVAMGALRARSPATLAMSAASRVLMGRADAVVALGEAMRQRCLAAGARPERTHVISNWADGNAIRPIPRAENPLMAQLLPILRPSIPAGASGPDLRSGRTISQSDRKATERESSPNDPAKRVEVFLVMYSGNMGRVHELDTLLGAARLLREREDIRFVFAGDGAKRVQVEAAARELPNVALTPYQPREKLAEALSVADVHLASLRPEFLGLVEPSKVYGIMAAGRPTVFVGPRDAEVARMLERERAGVLLDCGDTPELAATLLALSEDRSRRETLGTNARSALLARYSRRIATVRFRGLLARVTGQRP